MRTRHSLIAVAALSVLALAGCDKEALPGVPTAPGNQPAAATGGNDKGAASKPAAADPKALLANAAQASHDSSTYKFEYKMDSASGDGETGGISSKGEVDTRN